MVGSITRCMVPENAKRLPISGIRPDSGVCRVSDRSCGAIRGHSNMWPGADELYGSRRSWGEGLALGLGKIVWVDVVIWGVADAVSSSEFR